MQTFDNSNRPQLEQRERQPGLEHRPSRERLNQRRQETTPQTNRELHLTRSRSVQTLSRTEVILSKCRWQVVRIPSKQLPASRIHSRCWAAQAQRMAEQYHPTTMSHPCLYHHYHPSPSCRRLWRRLQYRPPTCERLAMKNSGRWKVMRGEILKPEFSA